MVENPTVGFTDRDWGDRRRPRHRQPTPTAETWTGRLMLAPETAGDPGLFARCRRELVERAIRYCGTYGYTADQETVSWQSWVVDETGCTQLELSVELVPRTDGEWSSIHAAIAEDERDRAEATAAAEIVHDGLDRLRSAREWWLAHPPPKRPEAARAPSTAASDPL